MIRRSFLAAFGCVLAPKPQPEPSPSLVGEALVYGERVRFEVIPPGSPSPQNFVDLGHGWRMTLAEVI